MHSLQKSGNKGQTCWHKHIKCVLPAASATADPTMAPIALLATDEAIC